MNLKRKAFLLLLADYGMRLNCKKKNIPNMMVRENAIPKMLAFCLSSGTPIICPMNQIERTTSYPKMYQKSITSI